MRESPLLQVYDEVRKHGGYEGETEAKKQFAHSARDVVEGRAERLSKPLGLEDRKVARAMARDMSKLYLGMGELMAMEFLAALGVLIAANTRKDK